MDDDETLDPVAKFLVWLESNGYQIVRTTRPAKENVRGEVIDSETILSQYTDTRDPILSSAHWAKIGYDPLEL
jgi:hypothetical protein